MTPPDCLYAVSSMISGEELAQRVTAFIPMAPTIPNITSLFLSGRFELVEGTHITDDMTNGIIISRELAEWNGLKIGDTLDRRLLPGE